MNIIQLPEEIKRGGFLYKLVERTELYAIYSQNDPGGCIKGGFEVFRVCSRVNHGTFAKKDLPQGQEYEYYPSDEEFGSSAWSFTTIEFAKECFEQLKSNSWRAKVYKPATIDLSPAWELSRSACVSRDKNICQSCKKRFSEQRLTAHHIISRSNHGSDDLENLITLCYSCHDEIEYLNLSKSSIIEYKKSQKIKVKPVKIEDDSIKDWHSWVYGSYKNPFMHGRNKEEMEEYKKQLAQEPTT
jgi:5-methylcytosine-specific restriction endonuclease McrA